MHCGMPVAGAQTPGKGKSKLEEMKLHLVHFFARTVAPITMNMAFPTNVGQHLAPVVFTDLLWKSPEHLRLFLVAEKPTSGHERNSRDPRASSARL